MGNFKTEFLLSRRERAFSTRFSTLCSIRRFSGSNVAHHCFRHLTTGYNFPQLQVFILTGCNFVLWPTWKCSYSNTVRSLYWIVHSSFLHGALPGQSLTDRLPGLPRPHLLHYREYCYQRKRRECFCDRLPRPHRQSLVNTQLHTHIHLRPSRKGSVTAVEYYHGNNDSPYMIATGNDKSHKSLLLSKSRIQTLEGQASNVPFTVHHPTLPTIVSGSEDGTVKIWHAKTYRLDNTLEYALERAWYVVWHRETNEVSVGFDNGVAGLKPGQDEPPYSMDPSGNLVYTRGSDVLTSTLQTAVEGATPEGARIPLPSRELGPAEIYANAIVQSSNGRFVTVVGDGEYVIYTSLAWRNKALGPGDSFTWGDDSNTHAM